MNTQYIIRLETKTNTYHIQNLH